MPSGGTGTDRTDFEIYRAHFPNREARFWGSRSAIDPRITVPELARRVGLSRTAVQARLLHWKRIGYWHGYEIWPNPRLFGAGLATVDVPLRTPAQVDRLLEELALVEGAVSARCLLDEDGRTVRVFLVDDGPDARVRRLRLLQRVAETPMELRAQPYWIPETIDELSNLDWRIVGYYRAYPDASLTGAAHGLGITAKTLSIRRNRLLDTNAIWWMLDSSSTLLPVTAMYLTLGDASQRSVIKAELEDRLPGWLSCTDDGFGMRPSLDQVTVAGLAFTTSPADVDVLVRRILSLRGVVGVRSRVPHVFRAYPDWFDRQIAQRVARISFRRTGRAVRTAPSVRSAPSMRRLSGSDEGATTRAELRASTPMR